MLLKNLFEGTQFEKVVGDLELVTMGKKKKIDGVIL